MSCLVALLIAFVTAGSIHAQILLEDFSANRQTSIGDLWHPYLGEDGGTQTYALENGTLRVNTNSGGYYLYFLPYMGGYTFPNGYAQHWIKNGTWDSNINRLRFQFKCSKSVSRNSSGGDNMQIGTYIKPHGSSDTAWQGAHYYHLLDMSIHANRWSVIEINRVPQHQVGNDPNTNWPENPSGPGVNYFDGLTVFYIDSQGGEWTGQTCYLREVAFDKEIGEPDDHVSSIQATYNGTRYEVTWAAKKNQNVQFEVRYSTSSMHANGFASGTAGGTVSNPGSAYTGTFWASPAMPEATMLYVAIKPSNTTSFTEIAIPTFSGGGPVIISDCDVNHDGSINGQDVNMALDAALGKIACAADLNTDNRCDAIDAQRIINASMGSTCLVGL